MILSSKTSNQKQSMRDTENWILLGPYTHTEKPDLFNCFKCGNSRIMHLRNCQAIGTKATKGGQRNLSQTHIFHQGFMKWIRNPVLKVTKSVGHLLTIQGRSSKWSCKDSSLSALVTFPPGSIVFKTELCSIPTCTNQKAEGEKGQSLNSILPDL